MKKHIITVLLIFSFAKHSYATNYLHQVCSVLFGRDQTSDEINSYFSQAAKNFNLPNSEKIPVKYIRKNLLLNQFSAFTWFGTWVDKNYWNAANEKQKEWDAHHETAHKALKHPTKQIVVTCLTTISTYLAAHALKLSRPYTALAIGATLAIVIPYYARICEKEADIKAANILCKNNKIDIVNAHIINLKSQTNNTCVWFYQPTKQADYLEETIKEHHDTKKS